MKSVFIVATIGSMSVGVNLQAANYMVFNDYPWVPADLAQAEKRIHRIGQKSNCFYYYIFSSGVDENIFQTILDKLKITREVTDGDGNNST
jgi:SNF2 family DNA or RNA helicase